jgi:hypothetical protein
MALSSLLMSAVALYAVPEAHSLFGWPLYAMNFTGLNNESLHIQLEMAKAALTRETCAGQPQPAKQVWVGRRTAYLCNYQQSISVYTAAVKQHPSYAPLYRHRGHRFLSTRQFQAGEADLAIAENLIQNVPGQDYFEADGAPNQYNIPLSTLHFNIRYHLGVWHLSHHVMLKILIAIAMPRSQQVSSRGLRRCHCYLSGTLRGGVCNSAKLHV